MGEVTIIFNGQNYTATYNEQSGYYEVEITAPNTGGIYQTEITYTDILNTEYTDSKTIQIWAKEAVKIEDSKVFMWIFSHDDFSVKDIVEISDYEINIDEETNANSNIKILKKTTAKARDIIAVKKNNEVIYWGIIDEVQNENGDKVYTFITKYITNLFDRTIQLENQDIIRNTGIEDFIGRTITNNYISSTDTFINLGWLQVNVLSHTPKETSVTNVENGIYNLHTWITNCTQNYNVVYSFSIVNKKLVMNIEIITYRKEIIDTIAEAVSNYTEVFETDVVSKVIVLYNKKNDVENPGSYTLFLLTDRTTTTNITNPNRAEGRVETIFTENYEDANQEALNVMKANSYNHNITFDLLDKFIKVGTPIAIKTKESIIFNTYISAIKITPKRFYEYVCGNIRISFIDKLLKERRS